MNYFKLKYYNLERNLPIVSMSPKLKVASLNLLGDEELVELLAQKLKIKLKGLDFDYLVGPEVKVVPVLQELSRLLGKKKYVVCRKQIRGYMVSPVKIHSRDSLVVDGNDATLIKNKKVIIVDDVVSSGGTLHAVNQLMEKCGAKVVAKTAIFIQGKTVSENLSDLIYLAKLPTFSS